jgi:hypothetical protein
MTRSFSHGSTFQVAANLSHVKKLLSQHSKNQILERQSKEPNRAKQNRLEIQNEIEAYDKNLKIRTQFLSGMLPQSCRNGVIPGGSEVRDEAVRTQLLVGKLRAEGSNTILNANNIMKLKKIKTGVEIAPIESRRPQILSDQVSGLTFSHNSSQVADTNDESQNWMET